MPVFSGNTSSSATSSSYDIASTIKSFSIVNKTGSTANVTVNILYGSTNISIYKGQINGSADYRDSVEQLLLAGRVIYLTADQQIDYYFTIE